MSLPTRLANAKAFLAYSATISLPDGITPEFKAECDQAIFDSILFGFVTFDGERISPTPEGRQERQRLSPGGPTNVN